MRELLFMAPMQIKEHLSIGNIYDLTLCDFYTKAKRLCGDEVIFPLLININGIPAEKLLDGKRVVTLDGAVGQLSSEVNSWGIHPDFTLRDDLDVSANAYLSSKYAVSLVNECPACGAIYGSDPGIHLCKWCGSKTVYHKRGTLAKTVYRDDILNWLESPYYIPGKLKNRLVDYSMSLPEEYSLILEKERKYTIAHDGFSLDPRFTSIMLTQEAASRAGKVDKVVCICGDLVKKYLYYLFAYAENGFLLPDAILVHGTVVDSNREKLRWQNATGPFTPDDFEVTMQELRTFFIVSPVTKNLVISNNSLRSNAIKMSRIRKRMERLLSSRQFLDKLPTDMAVGDVLQVFSTLVEKWQLPAAFKVAEDYVGQCEYRSTQNSLSERERLTLHSFHDLYFG